MVLIGGWRAKYLKARKRPKKKIHQEYKRRNEALPVLGYANYREYLKSEEWATIRAMMLKRAPRCLLCASKAVVVHHMSYDDRTILGIDTTWLICLCDGCHEGIELTPAGRKRTLTGANAELKRRATEAGRDGWVRHIVQKEKRFGQRLARDQRAETSCEADRKRKRKAESRERHAERAKWKGVWVGSGCTAAKKSEKKSRKRNKPQPNSGGKQS